MINIKKFATYSLVALMALNFTTQAFAGGVSGYTGTQSTAGAGVSSGLGNSASAGINLDFKVPKFMALGVYSDTGVISHAIFNAPATNFPAGTTLTSAAAPTVLAANESDLNSKFDLDGTVSQADALKIINAQNATVDAASQDIIIKGAVFSNIPGATTLGIATSANSITLTGGTGSAPVYDLKAVAGVPGSTLVTSLTPSTTPLALAAAQRNTAGYARFAVVGDLKESSVDLTTDGNWTGSFTITLTGL